jgi:hypothetical protein
LTNVINDVIRSTGSSIEVGGPEPSGSHESTSNTQSLRANDISAKVVTHHKRIDPHQVN